MTYRIILAATDGSDTAVRAQRRAATLARAHWATVILATAWRAPDLPRDVAEDVVAYARQDLRAAEIDVQTRVVEGEPGEALALAAADERVDLVVAGSLGLGGSKRLGLGTVAGAIAHAAPCDVLVVRTEGPGALAPTAPYRRLVIATDGSDTAFEAARRGLELAEVLRAEVTMVYVGDPLLGAIALERTLEGRPGTAPVTTVVREGSPAEQINAVAAETAADVVVVGNRGLTGLRGRVLGSVPAAVANDAPADVLIVRTIGRTVEDLEPGTAAVVQMAGRQAAVYVDDAGVRHALSARCQHLGCTVGWNHVDRTWDCPCHGSRYGFDGQVIRGPATKGLPVIESSGDR